MAQTILIVDDDPAQRRLLESVISAQGYRALTASDGKQALETLRGPKAAGIDLVLLDLVMPGVSGINVLEEVRPEMPGLPIVVLTANGSVATVVQAMQAGAENLVESILFGHEKGAFTGATTKKIGKFQEADGGTLFLDEVGELPPQVQVKLLRAIQEGEVDPVGGAKPIKVDIRLISATNKNLQQLVSEGTFREDLYYRLNVFPLNLPPLRERKEDIPELVDYFIRKFAAEEGKTVRAIEASARDMLSEYRWPGNVRQLENAVYRAVVLSDRDTLTLHDFPQIVGIAGHAEEQNLAIDGEGLHGGGANGGVTAFDADGHLRTLAEVEADMIHLAIRKYSNHMSEIARRLGIGRSTLYRKVRELGLDIREAG